MMLGHGRVDHRPEVRGNHAQEETRPTSGATPEKVAEALLRYRPHEQGPKPAKSDRWLSFRHPDVIPTVSFPSLSCSRPRATGTIWLKGEGVSRGDRKLLELTLGGRPGDALGPVH